MVLFYRLLNEKAKEPVKAHLGDAGFDVFACLDETILIQPGKQAVISTGITVGCPSNYCYQVWPRSGLTVKNYIDTKAGLIDSGYAGEVKIVLHNYHPTDTFCVEHGMKIAQLVPVQINPSDKMVLLVESEDDGHESKRGANGFGSTGTK